MSTFAGNVLKLAIGSVFAQGIGVLVAPIVARLFAPEAFGVAALFASIAGMIGAVACLRYELSIMLPNSDEEAANLLGVSFCFLLVVTCASALVIFLASDLIVKLLNSPELKKYLWLIPIAVFVSGTFLALNYWSSCTKHFGRLSIVRVVSSVVTQSTKLGAGFAGFISGGVLIVTSILGQFVCVVVLGGRIWRDDRGLFKTSIRWKEIIAGLKRYKRFPIYSTWAILLNNISAQVPIWILASFFSPTIVGFYALTIIVIGLPLSLIGGSVSQVFYQKASEANKRSNELPKVVENIFKRLVSIGMFPALLLMFIGKDVFIVVFGDRWAEAGVYSQILGPWLLFALITSSMNVLFNVLERQDVFLNFNIILCLTRAIILTVGGLIGEPRLVILFFSGTSLLITGWLCFWLFSRVGVPLVQVTYYFGKYAAYCLPILGITALAKWGFGLKPLGVLLVGFFGMILYYAIILKQDKELQKLYSYYFKDLGFLKQAKVLSWFLLGSSKK